MELACQCPAVVCCRCAPTQKAQIVRLLQERTGKLTCAVGKLAWVGGGTPREEEPAWAVVRLAWVVAVSCLRPCPVTSCPADALSFAFTRSLSSAVSQTPGPLGLGGRHLATDAAAPVSMSFERKETNVPKGKDLCMGQMTMVLQRGQTPC